MDLGTLNSAKCTWNYSKSYNNFISLQIYWTGFTWMHDSSAVISLMGLLITDGLTQILISVHGDFITKVSHNNIHFSASRKALGEWFTSHSAICHIVFNNRWHNIWQNSLPPKRWTLMQAYIVLHTHTHRSVTHSHKNVHTGLLFLLFDAQVPRWSLSVPSRRQPVSHEGRLAVGLWVWGLAEGDVDWNDMQVSVICGIQYTHAES